MALDTERGIRKYQKYQKLADVIYHERRTRVLGQNEEDPSASDAARIALLGGVARGGVLRD